MCLNIYMHVYAYAYEYTDMDKNGYNKYVNEISHTLAQYRHYTCTLHIKIHMQTRKYIPRAQDTYIQYTDMY